MRSWTAACWSPCTSFPEEAGAMANPDHDRPPLPDDALILLPVRNVVLFPGVVLPLSIARPKSIAASQEAVRTNRPAGIILQRDETVEDPTAADLHQVGTIASILRYVTAPDGTHHVVCQGEQRFRISDFIGGHPFLAARVERHTEVEVETPAIQARFLTLKQRAMEAVQLLPNAPPDLLTTVQAVPSASVLADMVATYMDLKPEEKQEILETFDLEARLDKVIGHLAGRIEVLRLQHEISQQTQATMTERQREFLLREQLRTIQRQLGEADDRSAEIEELSRAIAQAKMPPDVEEHARKELRRLERMPEAAAEYSMLRTYLEWLTELPWSVEGVPEIDIPH